ncbi:hypothetical protein [Jejuia spongiicola]|uniref:DUF4468 domain-containing protein n=1 Tax=Jejuia spongiicola TaxID=2942207 RepID=A0ABT0QFD9_9FLAO|nr:hypothetical protein [Jejuia spongiicola]MCL6295569.1 hypothetical protein [Jejuia spongiicola]
MRKTIFILTLLVFQQSLFSQKEIVGKVEFYKSEATEFALFRDIKDKYIKNLNKRISKIQLIQKDNTTRVETDSFGTFKVKVLLKDSIRFKVNEHSPIFNGQFEFGYNDIKDTLKLWISDKKLAIHRDSIDEPEFYKKYNEQKAELNFRDDKREILLIQYDWPKDKITEKRKRIKKTYDIIYEYFFNPSQVQMRIMYRYNKVMGKLIGIKENMW